MRVSNERTRLLEIAIGIEPADKTSMRRYVLGPLPAGTRPKVEFIKSSNLVWLYRDWLLPQPAPIPGRLSDASLFGTCN